MHDVTATHVDTSGIFITLPELADVAEDRERFIDAFLFQPASGEWRRIQSYNNSNPTLPNYGEAAISRPFTTAPVAGDRLNVYLLLTPTEWNNAIDEILTKLYFYQRDFYAIVDTQTEYTLGPWVQYKAQVVGARYRQLQSNTALPGKEFPIPRMRLDESDGTVILHLLDLPWSSVSWEIVVECMKYYPSLTSNPPLAADDARVTQVPEALWMPAVAMSALHKLNNKYGDKTKRLYNQELVLAERDYMVARAAVLPTLVAREYVQDEEWGGYPDIDIFFTSPGWAF